MGTLPTEEWQAEHRSRGVALWAAMVLRAGESQRAGSAWSERGGAGKVCESCIDSWVLERAAHNAPKRGTETWRVVEWLESLILAQDKRWRRALRMQVERSFRGQWRTGE